MRRAAGYNSEQSRQNGLPLPNLPGHSLSVTMAPRPKAHTLKYVNGYPIAEDVEVAADPLNRAYKWDGRTPDLGPNPPFALHGGAEPTPYPPQARAPEQQHDTGGVSSRVPNWIAYDRKVLRFGGYFQEEVPNSPLETWRIRKVAIRYYLENDQVEIVEMREVNSGLPQGTLLKRHSVIQEGGAPLRWSDLRVGGRVTLYRRTYHLVAADAPTRSFFAERGVEQPPDEGFPEGPYDQHRKQALEASRGRPAATRQQTSTAGGGPPLPADPDPFAGPVTSPRGPSAVFDLCATRAPPEIEARDGAVLRFMAAWDNTAVTFGEVLAFSLSYYVADGTVEVREVARRNSGRDPFPLLLRRGRLPKTLPPVLGRPMSPNTRRQLAIPYYDWRDLFLGTTVNVYGRPLVLYDCDEPTRTWLRQHVPGIREEQLTTIPVDFDPFGPKRPPLSIPPHSSGIGSEEDSLQNVLHLVPRRPPSARHAYTDYLEKWNKVLRFEGRMVPLGPGRPLVGPHDAERRFILSFHLLDRSLAIWEPKQENSGMEQGAFLERTRVANPATGQQYEETDMQVGSVLEAFGRGFQLLDADAATLLYMERSAYKFPWADYERVLSKLTTWLALYPTQLPDRLRSDLLAVDSRGGAGGYVTKHQLYALLSSLGSDVSPHEVVTLVRQLGADRQGLLVEQLLAALRLASPPPPPPVEHQAPEEPQQPQEPPTPQPPPVPFPAPGLRAGGGGGWHHGHRHHQQQQPVRRLAWEPHPAGPLVLGRGSGGAAAAGPVTASACGKVGAGGVYQGIGPIPGQPRVDPMPPAPATGFPGASSFQQKQQSQNHWMAPQHQQQHQRPYSGCPAGTDDASFGAGDDRRGARDTLDKSWAGFQVAAGNKQPGKDGLMETPSLAWGSSSVGGSHGGPGSIASLGGQSLGGGRGSGSEEDRSKQRDVAPGSGPGSASGAEAAAGAQPRQAQPAGRAAVGGRVGGSFFLTTGIKQPSALWQTTNMAFGGVGHSASFSQRR